MKTPASLSFQLAASRGASARGRRPSLRSPWSRSTGSAPLRRDIDRVVRNLLPRLAATRQDAGPDVAPSGSPIAPDAPPARKATQ